MSEKKVKRILAYKLRDNTTGLYLASGGKWTKMGKTWPRKSDAIRSINSLIKRAPKNSWIRVGQKTKEKSKDEIIDDLVLFEIVELSESNSYPVLFHVNKIRRE